MCGICGIYFPGQKGSTLSEEVKRMNKSLRHRGPDGSGLFSGDGVALGHRRLAIIDIVGGKQPMVDVRGFALSFNGEIYNFREIRRELETFGETFTTNSDTEVLLKAYIRWGENCLEKLNGMFTFAIADANSGHLFLARDRLGIKPLYYASFPGGMAFSSEISSLRCCSLVKTDLDFTYIPYYLMHSFFPGEHTPFTCIKKLPAGHYLLVRNGKLEIQCYWDIEEKYLQYEVHRASKTDIEELSELIREAVEMQTVSDVPIGALLSGGLDSSVIASAAASYLPCQLHTFTVGFRNSDNPDETTLAARTAAHYQTNHHEIHISPDDLLAHYELVLSHFGQPFADCSALPTYLIARFARNFVKTVLSGDGGDEQFGGYRNYRRFLQLRRFYSLIPGRGARKMVAGPAGAFARQLLRTVHPRLGKRLEYYSDSLKQAPAFLYEYLFQSMNLTAMATLVGDRLQPFLSAIAVHPPGWREPKRHLDGVMLHDLKNYLPDDVLWKVDMMSMAVGLEVRVPLLDHRVVEKAVSLSWKDKVSWRQTKTLLRRLSTTKLPPPVVAAPKLGFSIPLDQWFRGPLKEMAWDLLLGLGCQQRGVLNPTGVQALLEAHQSGQVNYGRRIWTLLALEKWFFQLDGN
jgi:asparagine synthase (glutamine-hydrolysing)